MSTEAPGKAISLIETKRLKQAIDANPEKLSQILEDTSLGICVTDAHGFFVAVNENYCRIYGYNRTELIGKHFSIVVPDAKVDDLKLLHDQFIENKFEILRNWEVVTKTGELIKIQVDAGYTEKINGKPHKITFIMPEH